MFTLNRNYRKREKHHFHANSNGGNWSNCDLTVNEPGGAEKL